MPAEADPVRASYRALAEAPVDVPAIRDGVRRRVRRHRAQQGVMVLGVAAIALGASAAIRVGLPRDTVEVVPAAGEVAVCAETRARVDLELPVVREQTPFELVIPKKLPEGACLMHVSNGLSGVEYATVSLGFRWDGASIQLLQTSQRYPFDEDPARGEGRREQIGGRAWLVRTTTPLSLGPDRSEPRAVMSLATRLDDGRTVVVDGQEIHAAKVRRLAELVSDGIEDNTSTSAAREECTSRAGAEAARYGRLTLAGAYLTDAPGFAEWSETRASLIAEGYRRMPPSTRVLVCFYDGPVYPHLFSSRPPTTEPYDRIVFIALDGKRPEVHTAGTQEHNALDGPRSAPR